MSTKIRIAESYEAIAKLISFGSAIVNEMKMMYLSDVIKRDQEYEKCNHEVCNPHSAMIYLSFADINLLNKYVAVDDEVCLINEYMKSGQFNNYELVAEKTVLVEQLDALLEPIRLSMLK